MAAPEAAQRFDFELGRGALGGRRHAEAVGERDDGADDRDRFDAALRGADDESPVDLDRRELRFAKIAYRRIAGAELVERQAAAERYQVVTTMSRPAARADLRRGGEDCASSCTSRWSPDSQKTQAT